MIPGTYCVNYYFCHNFVFYYTYRFLFKLIAGNKKESVKAATSKATKIGDVDTDDDSEFETSVSHTNKNKVSNDKPSIPSVTSAVGSNNTEKSRTTNNTQSRPIPTNSN